VAALVYDETLGVKKFHISLVVRFTNAPNLLQYLKKSDSPISIKMLQRRPLPDEHTGTKACNDAIPVQLSEPEFPTLLFPHLSMPKRGPKCTLGSQALTQHS